jgi:Ni,Fe-hydrogenase I cytochrome b subunit
MSETLFRLLEVIGILLPLTGIFIQVSFRLPDSDESVAESTTEPTFQFIRMLLLSAGLVLGLAGVVTTVALVLVLESLAGAFVVLLLYLAFVLLTAALAVLWTWAHPKMDISTQQQTLLDQGPNDEDES